MFEILNQLLALAEGSLSNPATAVPVYVLAGLASSLFPCVYPLIPVTAGFLQNRQQAGQARWLHPLVYWSGTVLSYTILGLVAAIGGGAFNIILQNGYVILGMGLLFLFLTFVMLDWVPLNWSGGDRLMHRAAAYRGLFFTLLMGVVAGLVASACVAPALVTMLVFIARETAAGGALTPGMVAYGGLLSFAFGAGIGVPFFLAGILGARLPRSGRWMSVIKYSFAIVIFAFALYEFHKGFTVLGFEDFDAYLILGGIALCLIAVALGLRPPAPEDGRAKTRFFFAVLALAFSIGLVVRGLNPPTLPIAEASFEPLGNLNFHRNRDAAYAEARATHRPIFIDFYADWCTNCKDFQNLAQSHAALNSALGQAVLLKIYDTDPVFEEFATHENYRELQIGLPFFLVLDPAGEFQWKGTNYRDTAGMIGAIEAATPASP
ncbi:MAG: thioredoxin family protein [Leptospiraceae bacterium]|nr:thioredoxin family protein [Leptospiraceae bacterium]